MRKYITTLYILLCLILLCNIKVKAQLTADFPDSNYSWNESHYTRGCDLTCPFNYVDGTMFDSTTHTFNNLEYRSIYFKGSSYSLLTHLTPPVVKNILNFTYLYGYIRNDKPNKKVYFRFALNDTTPEYLLYDFGLDLYEPYPVTLQNAQSSANFIVYRIDSTTDYKGTRRAIKYIGPPNTTNYNFGGVLIEGVGTLTGILARDINFSLGWSEYNSLNCIKNNSQNLRFIMGSVSIFTDSIENCFKHNYIITSVYSEKASNINIFPNPSSDFIYIDNMKPDANFTIQNIYGQAVPVTSEYINDKWIFDVKKLTRGMYFIHTFSDNKTHYGKIIKQ